jgi:hypothetical protein
MRWNPRCRYTGTEIEEEIIGHALVSWNGTYVPFKQSMRDVRANQPWDPSDPEPAFANDFHASVAVALGIEDYSELKLYTAVGSTLDVCHGIDCFFEFRGKIVTIDLTTNPSKVLAKANFVLNVSDEAYALDFGTDEVVRWLGGGRG